MEPNYVGANKHIDAMAVAWLFANDCVFFNPGEITWDGKHHGIVGAQINAEKVDEIPTFVEHAEMYYQGMGELLMALEADDDLIVPRGRIHPGLYDAIREGDLTGITLFNLQACARAFSFLGDENEGVKRSMLQMAGLEDVVNDPSVMACTHMIAVDQRLTRGIPGFYQLIRRMFEDMRAFNEIDLPYILVFTAARNFDADQCLDSFDDAVEGAVSESLHIETNIQEWNEAHSNADEVVSESGEETELDEDAAEEDVSNLLSGLADALRDLSDGLAESLGVFGEELLRSESDPSDYTWTFGQGKNAKGRRFSFAIPDQFDTTADDDTRTLAVLAFDDAKGDDLADEPVEILYSALLGDTDSDTVEQYRSSALPEMKMQLLRYTQHSNQIAAAIGATVDDWIIKGKNCLVLVYELMKKSFMPGIFPDNYEYYVKPLAFDHEDMLRITDNYDKISHDALRSLALEIAKTIELDKPVELKRQTQLKTYLSSKADLEEFNELVNVVANNLSIARNNRINADLWLAMNRAGDVKSGIPAEVPRLQATAFAKALEEEIPYYEQFIAVLEAQKRLGNPDFGEMWRFVGEVFDVLITDKAEIEDDEEGTRAVNATGIIKIPEGHAELHERWRTMGDEVLKRQEADTAADKAAEEEAKKAEEAAARERESARAAFDKLAKDIKGKKEVLESSRAIQKTSAEKEVDAAKKKVAELEDRLGRLGFFARAEKKQVSAELEGARRRLADLEAQVPAAKAQAKRQRDEAVAKVEAEIRQLEDEAKPFFDILKVDVVKRFKSLELGNTVEFGSYPQDSAKAKPTPIVWRVCKISQRTLTLMSEYILDVQVFNKKPKRANTYADSFLRSWLEGTFFNEAFDLLEQGLIKGGPFICTEKELKEYFRSDSYRVADSTAYAKSKGGDRFYWVATSKFEGEAYCVNGPGMIVGDHTMAFARGMSFRSVGSDVNEKLGVRPAIRVEI